jgi:hypothetical protein
MAVFRQYPFNSTPDGLLGAANQGWFRNTCGHGATGRCDKTQKAPDDPGLSGAQRVLYLNPGYVCSMQPFLIFRGLRVCRVVVEPFYNAE